MTERRTQEGSALRKFIDNQLDYLGNLFAQWEAERLAKKRQTRQENEQIERIVEGSDKRIRAVNGYLDQLRPCSAKLFLHVSTLLEALPEPITLCADAFSNTPLLNAFFVGPQDITGLLETSQPLKAYVGHQTMTYPASIHATLLSTRSEMTKLGMGTIDDKLVQDMVQTVVNFSNHQLTALSCDQNRSRAECKLFIIDQVLAEIAKSLAAKKPLPRAARTSAANLENSLNNPEVYLQALVTSIELAVNHIAFRESEITVNKFGVKLDGEDEPSANTFALYEFGWKNDVNYVVTPVVCVFKQPPKFRQMEF